MLRTSWQSLTGQTSSTRKLLEAGPGVLRILFTTEGILKLEAAGIARRNPNSTGVPDFTKLAQPLRMVGEHLDAESAHLLKVSKRGDRIAFAYATAAIDHRMEEWKLSQLHGRWLETYQQRHSEIARSQASHWTWSKHKPRFARFFSLESIVAERATYEPRLFAGHFFRFATLRIVGFAFGIIFRMQVESGPISSSSLMWAKQVEHITAIVIATVNS
jgi:hypothetical protein